MIRLPVGGLPVDAYAALRAYQDDVDAAPSYAARVEAAKRLFTHRNRSDNPTFQAVRNELDRMCRGPRRCMYCEDSVADEVEHFRPKDLYPEFVFAWENYLYACGRCNGSKSNQFALFSSLTGAVVEVTRSRGAPLVEPEPGDPLLIDPRHEDPLRFLRLDLRDTFLFQAMHPQGTREYERAQYTLKVLHLNEPEYMRDARENAYEAYCGILHRYILEKKANRDHSRLERKIAAIRRTAHPTVWAEMKRQREQNSDLRALFRAAPEALDW